MDRKPRSIHEIPTQYCLESLRVNHIILVTYPCVTLRARDLLPAGVTGKSASDYQIIKNLLSTHGVLLILKLLNFESNIQFDYELQISMT